MGKEKRNRRSKPKPYRKREVAISTHYSEATHFPLLRSFVFVSLALEERLDVWGGIQMEGYTFFSRMDFNGWYILTLGGRDFTVQVKSA